MGIAMTRALPFIVCCLCTIAPSLDHGQPVPWVIQSRLPDSKREPATPALFADFEHDGRMHLVVTDCAYSTPPRFGEDRSITGIYVAENGKNNK